MTTHEDIAAYIETLGPPRGQDEGFKFGDPTTETTGALVCWMATVEALEVAATCGANLVITHEELHFPYSFLGGNLADALTWSVNRLRFTALAVHGLTVYRAHGQLDRYCILDLFGEAIGLPKPSVNEGNFRIYDIEPVSVGELAGRTKEMLGLPHLRVSGDLDAVVKRVGLPWGGLGLSLNVSFINGILQHGPDVLIAGECDEYAFRFTEDAGVPMIETGHSASENPGLARFADVLQAQFPALAVAYHEVPCPWATV